jgi:hypothetical protein
VSAVTSVAAARTRAALARSANRTTTTTMNARSASKTTIPIAVVTRSLPKM